MVDASFRRRFAPGFAPMHGAKASHKPGPDRRDLIELLGRTSVLLPLQKTKDVAAHVLHRDHEHPISNGFDVPVHKGAGG